MALNLRVLLSVFAVAVSVAPPPGVFPPLVRPASLPAAGVATQTQGSHAGLSAAPVVSASAAAPLPFDQANLRTVPARISMQDAWNTVVEQSPRARLAGTFALPKALGATPSASSCMAMLGMLLLAAVLAGGHQWSRRRRVSNASDVELGTIAGPQNQLALAAFAGEEFVGGLAPSNSERSLTSIARRDGMGDETPDGRPGDVMVDAGFERSRGNYKKVSGLNYAATQFESIQRRIKWLRSLKGKFVPHGQKPWHTPKFMQVKIKVDFDSATGQNKKQVAQVVEELRRISGRHPVKKVREKPDAVLGWREGMIEGVEVMLRKTLMFDFLDRLNMVVLPRVRDFEGLYPNTFRHQDNYYVYELEIESQESFKELDDLQDDREYFHGFQIAIETSAYTQPDGLKLMKDFGFPFGDPKVFEKKVKLSKEETREEMIARRIAESQARKAAQKK